jgi:triacylglycerol esterase/lipase EstA (alpha/beta hydrolase family)
MIVAGLDSSLTDGGASSALPADALGYGAAEVSYFSYARDGGDYAPADTEDSIRIAARRLGAQLRALERREPGREVDLLGHSQGGVVVAEFLTHVYDAADPSYPPLGTVVTLSAPFGGTPIATAAAGAARTSAGRAAIDLGNAVADRLGVALPDAQSASARDLAEDSAFTRHLEASKLPDQVQLTAIGASTDFLVPASLATRNDARNTVVVPHGLNAHSAIVTDPSALMATRAALEQRPLPCRSLASTVAAEVVSTGIVTGVRAAGAVLALAVGAGS